MDASYTIPQFCAAYHFSRVYYYTLKAQGKAPKELRLGRRVVITRKCAEEWEARLLAEQTAEQSCYETRGIRTISEGANA